ncbi:hypothetical protein E4U44_005632 [Claviceps purpurea]|nr:hypothetical protein E4U44_005632 [Claviceps purpurea]
MTCPPLASSTQAGAAGAWTLSGSSHDPLLTMLKARFWHLVARSYLHFYIPPSTAQSPAHRVVSLSAWNALGPP